MILRTSSFTLCFLNFVSPFFSQNSNITLKPETYVKLHLIVNSFILPQTLSRVIPYGNLDFLRGSVAFSRTSLRQFGFPNYSEPVPKIVLDSISFNSKNLILICSLWISLSFKTCVSQGISFYQFGYLVLSNCLLDSFIII